MLANAVCQSVQMSLIHRIREQARSHIYALQLVQLQRRIELPDRIHHVP